MGDEGRAGAGQGPRRRRVERLLGEAATAPPGRPGRPAVAVPPALRRAALAVAVEALLLAGVAAFLLARTLAGAATSTANALGVAAYVAIGAAVLAAGAAGLWRAARWVRAPVVVLQILLGLLGLTLAFDGARPELGLPLLVPVAVTVYLLLTPEARLAYLEQDQP